MTDQETERGPSYLLLICVSAVVASASVLTVEGLRSRWADQAPARPELPVSQARELLIFHGSVLEQEDGGSCRVAHLRRTQRELLVDFACAYPVQDSLP